MKMWTKWGVSLLGLSFLLLCNGCLIIGNRAADQHRTKTLGEELVDLKKAKDHGVLSDTEYETQRAKLLEAKRR